MSVENDEKNKKLQPPSHGDYEQDIDHSIANSRAVKGAASLLSRQIIMRILGLFGILILARILSPEIFGIFAIIHFIVMFFEEFSTIGLGPALIRKKDKVTETELRTVFTIQQAIILLSVTLIFISAPYITAHYKIDDSNILLIRIMAVALLFSSLKTIPSILLERNLRHDLIAMTQVVEYIVYLATAISLAVLDFGISALVTATILRTATGTIITNYLSWWKPAIGVDTKIAKKLMKFAIPMQLSSVVNVVQTAIIPVLIGSLMGAAAVGFVNLSRTLMESLVNQPLQQLGRIQFRLFSRFQDDKKTMALGIEKAIFIGSIFVFPLLFTFIALVEPFIHLVVTSKWAPSIPLIYILGLGYLSQVIVVPCMQALKALGNAWTPLKVVFLRAALTTLLILILQESFGILSFAIAVTVSMPLTAIAGLSKLRGDVPVRYIAQALPPFVAASISGIALYVIYNQIGDVTGFITAVLLSPVVNFILLGLICGDRAGLLIEAILIRLTSGSARMNMIAHTLRVILYNMDFSRRIVK